MKDIMQIVTQTIVDKLGVKPEQITAEANFGDDLGSDSLDTAEVIEELEREFNIKIHDEDLEKMKTVGQVTAYIRQHTKV